MVSRTWTADDPQPEDWPVVVGPDGVTWGRDLIAARAGLPDFYRQQKIIYRRGGAVLGPDGVEFDEIFDHYPKGSVLREAAGEAVFAWAAFREAAGEAVFAWTEVCDQGEQEP